MTDQLHDALSELLAARGLELFDLEVRANVVRVTVDKAGGIDLDTLAEANKAVSAALDALDPFPGRYTLEVSSPGIERRLRTPAHFAGAVGQTVSVRTLPGTTEVRRLQGTLTEADEHGFALSGPDLPDGGLRLGYDEVERARTVFEWATPGAPSPSRGKGRRPADRSAARQAPGGTGATSTERVTTP